MQITLSCDHRIAVLVKVLSRWWTHRIHGVQGMPSSNIGDPVNQNRHLPSARSRNRRCYGSVYSFVAAGLVPSDLEAVSVLARLGVQQNDEWHQANSRADCR